MRLAKARRRLRAAPALCSLVLFLASKGVALAAPVAPSPLRDAVASAWRAHPQSRAVEATLAAARARADAADRPLYNPELSLSADDEGPDRSATAGLSLALDLGGKRRARAAVGEAQWISALAKARQDRQRFAADWLAGWAAWQSALARARRGEEQFALLQRVADLATKQFAVGDISPLERDLALLARDEADAAQAGLVAELAEAEEAFRNVGGEPVAGPADPGWASALPPAAPPAPGMIEALPDWQLAQAEARAAEDGVVVARRERLPDPTLGVIGGRIDLGPTSDRVVGLSISVPLPVLNGGRAEVVAARAEADAAAARAESATISLSARADRAAASYAAVDRAWRRWRDSPGTDPARRAELLERLWRAGELSTAEYLQQLKQSLDTALAGAALEGQRWRRAADYLLATGQLESWLALDAPGETSR